MKNIYWPDGDADEPRSDDVGRGLGATTKRNESVLSQELEKQRKESRFSLCLVKRKLLKVIIIRIK